MSGCCGSSSLENSPRPPREGTGSSAATKEFLSKLRVSAKSSVLFGQMDAVLTGCHLPTDPPTTAPSKWTVGDLWASGNFSDLPLPKTDLFHALRKNDEDDASLEPALFGFDMGFIADIEFLAETTGYQVLKLMSFWPFADILDPPPPVLVSESDIEGLAVRSRNLHVELVRKIHAKNGVVTFGWHPQNPLITDRFSFELRDKENQSQSEAEVESIFQDSGSLDRLNAAIDLIAEFANACTVSDTDDTKIPIIFRPFHEMNINYFWWGAPVPGPKYQVLYEHLVARLREAPNSVDNLLYVFAPNAFSESNTNKMTNVLETYEPHNYDIIGLDAYPNRMSSRYGKDARNEADVEKNWHDIVEFANDWKQKEPQSGRNKVVALTEVGLLNLRRLSVEFNHGNLVNSATTYDNVCNYWTGDFKPLLLRLLESFERPDNVTGDMIKYKPAIAWAMLWKNRLSSDDIEAQRASIFATAKQESTAANSNPNVSWGGGDLFSLEEADNEYYGPYAGHCSVDDFKKILKSRAALRGKNILPSKRLKFLKDFKRGPLR